MKMLINIFLKYIYRVLQYSPHSPYIHKAIKKEFREIGPFFKKL